jgi:hypothetical protein
VLLSQVWAVACQLPRIRSLSLSARPSARQLIELLAECTALESLTLSSQQDRFGDGSPEFEFARRHVWWDTGAAQDGAEVRAALARAPALRRFDCHRSSRAVFDWAHAPELLLPPHPVALSGFDLDEVGVGFA